MEAGVGLFESGWRCGQVVGGISFSMAMAEVRHG
jgi:hypothetical protein